MNALFRQLFIIGNSALKRLSGYAEYQKKWQRGLFRLFKVLMNFKKTFYLSGHFHMMLLFIIDNFLAYQKEWHREISSLCS